MKRLSALALILSLELGAAPPPDRARQAVAGLDALAPELDALYQDLHRSPELSHHEEKTAAKMAARLRALGFEVTEKVGGFGVVGVLRNGTGPTVLLRTDLDGLPVEEKTGLPYASTVRTKDDSGADVGVMHACGHDLHMSIWTGTATLLSRAKASWKGTLVMVGQPAEERGQGAKGMLDAGLYTRFPKPDFALALHDAADLPSGKIGYVVGPALASADSVDIVVYGKGGHGAYPHKTIDPIVIAARIVVALQTLVSRENDPLDPAVVTVGSIHGGSKHNIIPDEVRLQLTVRAYKDEVRDRLLASIARVARAEAAAGGAVKEPLVTHAEGTPVTVNDRELVRRLVPAIQRQLGEANVVETPPVMGAEDFSEYGRAGARAAILWVGAAEPGRHAEALKAGTPLPSLHSALFAPDRVPALRTGVTALTGAALELLGR